MTDQRPIPPDTPIDDADILVSRLVDGVHSQSERDQFEMIAAGDPDLWRTLATHQLDQRLLEDRVTELTAGADMIEIAPHTRSRLIPRRTTWTLALSGWAAVLMLSLTWASMSMLGQPDQAIRRAGTTPPRVLSPEEHLERYLQAPWVSGEQSVMFLNSEELPDGSIRIHFMRRINETAIIPPGDAIPEQDGYLTADPANLPRE